MTIATASRYLFVMFLLVTLSAQAGWDPRKDKVSEAIANFKQKDPDMEIFFKEAYGYAVFPSVKKGGLGSGGAGGKGVVYEKGKLVGRATLAQATIGFQLGGQVFSEIIFFRDKAAIDRFKRERVEFSAQATAVAATAGAAATADYSNGVAVFTLAKVGLMYEASIGGQSFSYKPVE